MGLSISASRPFLVLLSELVSIVKAVEGAVGSFLILFLGDVLGAT